jgi:hypothetical protein
MAAMMLAGHSRWNLSAELAQRVQEFLEKYRNWDRIESIEALGKIGPLAVPLLALRDGMAPDQQVAAIRALVRINTSKAMSALGAYANLAAEVPHGIAIFDAMGGDIFTRYDNVLNIEEICHEVQKYNFTNKYAKYLTDLAPLQGLKQLTKLYLNNTPVQDLAPLQGLTQLTELFLNDTPVQDLAPLQGTKQLTTLSLRNTQVQDLAPLQGLKQLDWLDLDNTQVKDLAPLQGLKQLTYLDLTNTKVTKADVDALRRELPICLVSGRW